MQGEQSQGSDPPSKFCTSSAFQLVFSFCDKLFGLLIKDIDAMDPSILKGEPASGKKNKVQRSPDVTRSGPGSSVCARAKPAR